MKVGYPQNFPAYPDYHMFDHLSINDMLISRRFLQNILVSLMLPDSRWLHHHFPIVNRIGSPYYNHLLLPIYPILYIISIIFSLFPMVVGATGYIIIVFDVEPNGNDPPALSNESPFQSHLNPGCIPAFVGWSSIAMTRCGGH